MNVNLKSQHFKQKIAGRLSIMEGNESQLFSDQERKLHFKLPANTIFEKQSLHVSLD